MRETGSFKEGLGVWAYPDRWESDVEFFQAEADRFATEFRGQARLTADRMLEGSLVAIRHVLHSYGLPFYVAQRVAELLASGSDVDTEAEKVVKAAAKSDDVDAPDRVRHRLRLAQWVKYLKKRQQTVAERLKASNLAGGKREPRGWGAGWDAADKADAELAAARNALKAAWIEAERLHPILASYRRGGELEKIDLGTLHTDPVERQMKAILVQLLPKMVDIGKARSLVKNKKNFALTLPSVVALTRANMFIPAGSIRAGVVNDLVAAAKDDEDSVLVKVAAFALAIVTLIPSGGASLAIPAGIAAAGLAAYSAAKEWEQYETQKTLVNTDIDLARSLSTEEPSLTGFAVSLVGLGLEGIPLIAAFNKARNLKKLVDAGEDTTAAVRELNAIGKSRGAPDLGEQALRARKSAGKRGQTPIGTECKSCKIADDKALVRRPTRTGGEVKITRDGILFCASPCDAARTVLGDVKTRTANIHMTKNTKKAVDDQLVDMDKKLSQLDQRRDRAIKSRDDLVKAQEDALKAKDKAKADELDKQIKEVDGELEQVAKDAGNLHDDVKDFNRRLELGTDPGRGPKAKAGEFLPHEADAADKIETIYGVRLERVDPNNPQHQKLGLAGDWFDPVSKKTYDAVGPVPKPNELMNPKQLVGFKESVENHVLKDLDVIFVDLTGIDATIASDILKHIDGLRKKGFKAKELKVQLCSGLSRNRRNT